MKRRNIYWAWVGAACLCCAPAGCGAPGKKKPAQRTIEELVKEALVLSRVRHGDPALVLLREALGEEAGAAPPGQAAPGDATVASPQTDAAAAFELFPDSDSSPKVTDTFLETALPEAILSLANQAGVSVVIDNQVLGTANAVFDREPFESALGKLLLPYGYVFLRQGETYLVGPVDPVSPLYPYLVERHDYNPRYLSVKELMDLLPERMKKFVRANENRNLMIVEAPRSTALGVMNELRLSDQPVAQVVLEAIVCVVTSDDRLRFGFDAAFGVKLGGDSAFNFGLSDLLISGMVGPGQMATLKNFDFVSILLKSLASEGYLSIRASPRVMAKDGEKASISIGRETFFTTQVDNAQFFFNQDIQKVESGIVLEIRPLIRGDFVTVQIEKAEVSEDIRSSQTTGRLDENLPIINRRKVSTVVHVRDGETIVIGGLVERHVIERMSRVPMIGRVPWLGVPFRQIDNEESESEVVIFISPRIVRERRP